MSLNEPNEAQAAFSEASACFSEEEWALLQEWQKELYRNVMKEVHQALISLGPLIATTVFSLRAKEKEEISLTDNQYSERQQSINHSPRDTFAGSDVLFRIEHEELTHLNSPLHSKEQEGNMCLRAGVSCPNTDIVSREKKEPVSIFIDHRGVEMRESSTNLSSGYEVVSLRIKDEKEVYCIENEESQRMEIISNPTGGEIMNRKKKVGNPIKRPERAPPCKPFSGKTKSMISSTCMKEVNSIDQIWSDCNQETRGENSSQCESNFSQSVHVSLHQASHSIGRLDTYAECENTVQNLQIPTDLAYTQQHHIPYACSKGSRKNCLKGDRTRNVRTNTRIRPYACTECDKSFFQKTHLIIHQRIHSGEKPYMCIFCHKRFNRKDYLNEHVRIHTGERPYKCSKCEKSFIQKSHLNEHQRKHT